MKYEEWLNETITTPFGLSVRRNCLKNFSNILFKFVESKGYYWGISEKSLTYYISYGMWENSKKSYALSEWNYSNINYNYNDDDYNNYLSIFDSETWEYFWSRYGGWYDVDDDSSFRAQDRRHDIQEFVWKQIDIPNSPQTHLLYDSLYNIEDEVAPSPQVDVYIQESLEYNGWGGMRK